MAFTDTLATAKKGIGFLENIRTYAKYFDAAIQTLDFAITKFSEVYRPASGPPAQPAESPNGSDESEQ